MAFGTCFKADDLQTEANGLVVDGRQDVSNLDVEHQGHCVRQRGKSDGEELPFSQVRFLRGVGDDLCASGGNIGEPGLPVVFILKYAFTVCFAICTGFVSVFVLRLVSMPEDDIYFQRRRHRYTIVASSLDYFNFGGHGKDYRAARGSVWRRFQTENLRIEDEFAEIMLERNSDGLFCADIYRSWSSIEQKFGIEFICSKFGEDDFGDVPTPVGEVCHNGRSFPLYRGRKDFARLNRMR